MSSRTRVALPNFLTAASFAAWGDMPRAMFSSVSIAMYDAISRAASSSRRLRRKNRIQLMSFLRRLQHLADRPNQLFPSRRLGGQHLPAGRGETVVLRLAVDLRRAPERRDQPAILEA